SRIVLRSVRKGSFTFTAPFPSFFWGAFCAGMQHLRHRVDGEAPPGVRCRGPTRRPKRAERGRPRGSPPLPPGLSSAQGQDEHDQQEERGEREREGREEERPRAELRD